MCQPRVTDHKHHVGDVIAGAILGVALQFLNVVFVMRLFSKDKEEEEKERKMETQPKQQVFVC